MFARRVHTISISLLTTLALASIALMPFKSGKACGSDCDMEPLQSHIQPIDRYNEVQAVIDTCHQNTLVTFDVDDTLHTASDVFARTPEVPFWFKLRLALKHLPTLLRSKTREKAIDDFLSTFLSQVPRFVFDPDVVRLIRQLQLQKCSTVALTSLGSGSAGVIKSLPEWRATMLQGFGIDFSGSYADVSFTQFPMSHNNYPCLYKGMLCSNYMPKGAVLGAFLDHYHLKPERIISFDDQLSALKSIAEECKKRQIHFFGFQILGAKKLPGEWSTDRALLQFDTALEHGRWLSDKEADAILTGEPQRC
jgi:hypothetical protein